MAVKASASSFSRGDQLVAVGGTTVAGMPIGDVMGTLAAVEGGPGSTLQTGSLGGQTHACMDLAARPLQKSNSFPTLFVHLFLSHRCTYVAGS